MFSFNDLGLGFRFAVDFYRLFSVGNALKLTHSNDIVGCERFENELGITCTMH